MFVISITYTRPLDEVDQHIDAHVDYLKQCYAANKVIVSGRKVPRTGGVIIARADSREDVDQLIQEDPFFKANVAHFDVTEFIPTMASEAFSGLKELG